MIHGARAGVRYLANKDDPLSGWLRHLLTQRHKNIAVVAVANRNARIVWALLADTRQYGTEVLLLPLQQSGCMAAISIQLQSDHEGLAKRGVHVCGRGTASWPSPMPIIRRIRFIHPAPANAGASNTCKTPHYAISTVLPRAMLSM
jgi:hypothetical protein